LFPESQKLVSNIVFPALLGEMATMLWLLTRGAAPKALAGAANRTVPPPFNP